MMEIKYFYLVVETMKMSAACREQTVTMQFAGYLQVFKLKSRRINV